MLTMSVRSITSRFAAGALAAACLTTSAGCAATGESAATASASGSSATSRSVVSDGPVYTTLDEALAEASRRTSHVVATARVGRKLGAVERTVDGVEMPPRAVYEVEIERHVGGQKATRVSVVTDDPDIVKNDGVPLLNEGDTGLLVLASPTAEGVAPNEGDYRGYGQVFTVLAFLRGDEAQGYRDVTGRIPEVTPDQVDELASDQG